MNVLRLNILPEPPPRETEPPPRKPDSFATLLRQYRERAGRSRNALAREVGVDPSYLTRIEHGERDVPRQHIIEALYRALLLTIPERNQFLAVAGYAPYSIVALGWDAGLQAYTDVMTDKRLTAADQEAFQRMVVEMAFRWQHGGYRS